MFALGTRYALNVFLQGENLLLEGAEVVDRMHHVAAGKREVCEFLLASGADSERVDSCGRTALVHAVRLIEVSVPACCSASVPSRTQAPGGTVGNEGLGPGPGPGPGPGGAGGGCAQTMRVPLPESWPVHFCGPARSWKLRLTAPEPDTCPCAVCQPSTYCGGG